MFKPGLNEFLGHTVVCVDRRLIQNEEVRELFTASAAVASVYAAKAKEEAIKAVEPYWQASGTEHLMSLVGKFKDGDVFIGVDMQMMEKLTREELLAILHHEHAHIVHGDLDVEPNVEFDGVKLVVIQEKELRADQYSAMYCGKDAMRTGLQKVVNYSAEMHGLDYDEFQSMLLSDPDHTQRINALM